MNAAVLDTPRLLLREMTRDDLGFVATMLAHPRLHVAASRETQHL
jgi:hypothetical protein